MRPGRTEDTSGTVASLRFERSDSEPGFSKKFRVSDCTAGRSGRARTDDTRFWRPVLYQLSYTPAGVRQSRTAADALS